MMCSFSFNDLNRVDYAQPTLSECRFLLLAALP